MIWILAMSHARDEKARGTNAIMAALHTNMRAQAVDYGLPPLVALATRIATASAGNTVAYRASGPIPAGLYHEIFTGRARPKPVTEKAKSSTIGPQAGRAVADPRLGRYDRDKITGQYKLREDKPPALQSTELKISLRNLYTDVEEKKYALVNGKNPDEMGNLKFYELHPSPLVRGIIYSVNVKNGEQISPSILNNYKLVSNQFKNMKAIPQEGSPFFGCNLDALYTISAQLPEDKEAKPIKILGSIVRDCDIDFMTDPTRKAMEDMLGPEPSPGFFKSLTTPLDMSPHFHPGADKNEILKETKRAHEAVQEMIQKLIEINDLKWAQFDKLKELARAKEGSGFDEAKWEKENANLKPFVRRDDIEECMATMVVTVGKGTPMQLYQALEINIIEQKILASMTKPGGTRVDTAHLDNDTNKNIKNSALMLIHQQEIDYNRSTIAHAFIQHPSECHNEHYTSPREGSVAIRGNKIVIGGDAIMSRLVQENGEYIPINPKWIAEGSPGNQSAETWVKHVIINLDKHYKDKLDVKNEVDKYLINPKNVNFIYKITDPKTMKIFMDYLSNVLNSPQNSAAKALWVKNFIETFNTHYPSEEKTGIKTNPQAKEFAYEYLANLKKSENLDDKAAFAEFDALLNKNPRAKAEFEMYVSEKELLITNKNEVSAHSSSSLRR